MPSRAKAPRFVIKIEGSVSVAALVHVNKPCYPPGDRQNITLYQHSTIRPKGVGELRPSGWPSDLAPCQKYSFL